MRLAQIPASPSCIGVVCGAHEALREPPLRTIDRDYKKQVLGVPGQRALRAAVP